MPPRMRTMLLARYFTHYRPLLSGFLTNTVDKYIRRSIHETGKGSFFITTPIFYVNAAPHLGHAYTAVLADAIARWHRLNGEDVLYSTGTDEHGLKIQQAAESKGMLPQQFCDSISYQFMDLFNQSNISHSNYIRTTDPTHKQAVTTLWNRLIETNSIYKGTYEGWYSTSDEVFLSDDQVMDRTDSNGNAIKVSVESGRPVEWTAESNYMFRLSEYAPRLLEWINSDVIVPDLFAQGLRKRLHSGLADLSVSRERSRLQWGIPVPNDDTQTIYVWLDALTNYLTVAGYPDNCKFWPADVHVVGKDILTFHALYWPAFLMAAGLPLPKKILCHSHWLTDGVKMSKSLGNVVDPLKSMQMFGVDGFRYYLLRDGVPHSDGNYRVERAVTCLNAELSNTLGNLLSRCTGKAINPEQQFPLFDEDVFYSFAREEDVVMWKRLRSMPDAVGNEFESLHVYRAIDLMMAQIRDTNEFVQCHEPWQLIKDPSKQAQLHAVLHVALESLRVTGILLQPVMPELATKLLNRLNISADSRTYCASEQFYAGGNALGSDTGPLYKRLKT